MNIVFFNSNNDWGGGEKWHFEIAQQLHKKKHRVYIFCYRKGELYRKSLNACLNAIPVNIGNLSFLNIFKIARIISILKKINADILIINLSSDLKIAGIAGKLAGVNKIIYRRGSAIPIKNSISNKLIFRYLVDRIIANSYQTKSTILEHNENLFPSQNIKVIYNGIDLAKFDSSYECRPRSNEIPIIIGNLGRMVKQKNQIQLIEIAEKLKSRGVDFKLVIGGDGELKEKLQHEIKSKQMERYIDLIGFVDNVKQFMESIDIFVLPSLWEGFGYVLVEAQACKKPVITFNLSSNPEVLNDKETGFLVDQNKTDEFVSYITLLANDGTLRTNMGLAARKLVEHKFNIENTLSEVERFLLR